MPLQGVSCGHFRLEYLIFDRSRKSVDLQSPAACATRSGGDSGPNFENLFHTQSSDTGRCVYNHSWRVNQDVDVRR